MSTTMSFPKNNSPEPDGFKFEGIGAVLNIAQGR